MSKGKGRCVPEEARECISFYDERGWDWSTAVAFILAKHIGLWAWMKDHYYLPRRTAGRKGKR